MTDPHSHLVRCFKAVFPNLCDEEITQASLMSVADWDSLAAINLLTVIEEEFHLQIAPEDVEDMVSFALILDYLKRNNGAH